MFRERMRREKEERERNQEKEHEDEDLEIEVEERIEESQEESQEEMQEQKQKNRIAYKSAPRREEMREKERPRERTVVDVSSSKEKSVRSEAKKRIMDIEFEDNCEPSAQEKPGMPSNPAPQREIQNDEPLSTATLRSEMDKMKERSEKLDQDLSLIGEAVSLMLKWYNTEGKKLVGEPGDVCGMADERRSPLQSQQSNENTTGQAFKEIGEKLQALIPPDRRPQAVPPNHQPTQVEEHREHHQVMQFVVVDEDNLTFIEEVDEKARDLGLLPYRGPKSKRGQKKLHCNFNSVDLFLTDTAREMKQRFGRRTCWCEKCNLIHFPLDNEVKETDIDLGEIFQSTDLRHVDEQKEMVIRAIAAANRCSFDIAVDLFVEKKLPLISLPTSKGKPAVPHTECESEVHSTPGERARHSYQSLRNIRLEAPFSQRELPTNRRSAREEEMTEKKTPPKSKIASTNPVIMIDHPSTNGSMLAQRVQEGGHRHAANPSGFRPPNTQPSFFSPPGSQALHRATNALGLVPPVPAIPKSSSQRASSLNPAATTRSMLFDDRGTHLETTPLMLPNVTSILLNVKSQREPIKVKISDLVSLVLQLRRPPPK